MKTAKNKRCSISGSGLENIRTLRVLDKVSHFYGNFVYGLNYVVELLEPRKELFELSEGVKRKNQHFFIVTSLFYQQR